MNRSVLQVNTDVQYISVITVTYVSGPASRVIQKNALSSPKNGLPVSGWNSVFWMTTNCRIRWSAAQSIFHSGQWSSWSASIWMQGARQLTFSNKQGSNMNSFAAENAFSAYLSWEKIKRVSLLCTFLLCHPDYNGLQIFSLPQSAPFNVSFRGCSYHTPSVKTFSTVKQTRY